MKCSLRNCKCDVSCELVYNECHITAEYVCVCKDAGAGLLAAAMIAVVPGYISRSVAGSYDNEGMHAAAMH